MSKILVVISAVLFSSAAAQEAQSEELQPEEHAVEAAAIDPPPPPKLDANPTQYNVELPTGDQRQPVYFTKDMVFNIGTAQIGFYGFIKADYLGETRITGNTADIFPNTVPTNADLADHHTQSLLDARSSRFGIKIEDLSGSMTMKGAIEADFSTTSSDNTYGNAVSTNSRLFRLRLAYASAETKSHFFFLVGQYYGLPMHYPEIDMPTRVNLIHYPVGVVDSRQPQFRLGYKQYLSETSLFQYEANVENQGYNVLPSFVTPQGGAVPQASEQKWPLFNAKISYLSNSIKWDAAVSASRAYAITNALGNRLDASVWGVITNASYTWKNLILWGSLHHWVGLTGLTSGYFSQMSVVNNQLFPVKANGGAVALRYDFIKAKLWTDVMYGVEHCDLIPGSVQFSGSNPRKLDDFRVNLVGAFLKHWQMGIEYERNTVETFNNLRGIDHMVHIGVWYIFGQP